MKSLEYVSEYPVIALGPGGASPEGSELSATPSGMALLDGDVVVVVGGWVVVVVGGEVVVVVVDCGGPCVVVVVGAPRVVVVVGDWVVTGKVVVVVEKIGIVVVVEKMGTVVVVVDVVDVVPVGFDGWWNRFFEFDDELVPKRPAMVAVMAEDETFAVRLVRLSGFSLWLGVAAATFALAVSDRTPVLAPLFVPSEVEFGVDDEGRPIESTTDRVSRVVPGMFCAAEASIATTPRRTVEATRSVRSCLTRLSDVLVDAVNSLRLPMGEILQNQ